MGFLTTIVIHNDALSAFEKDPEAFGRKILELFGEANSNSKTAEGGI